MTNGYESSLLILENIIIVISYLNHQEMYTTRTSRISDHPSQQCHFGVASGRFSVSAPMGIPWGLSERLYTCICVWWVSISAPRRAGFAPKAARAIKKLSVWRHRVYVFCWQRFVCSHRWTNIYGPTHTCNTPF